MDASRHIIMIGILLAAGAAGCGAQDPVGADVPGGAAEASVPDGGSPALDAGAEAETGPAPSDSAFEGDSRDGAAGAAAEAMADAGIEADAAADVAEADTHVESVPDGPAVCGDGLRDPATEECDDGLGDDAGAGRACTSTCSVLDRTVETEPGVLERRLGTGRHPVGAGDKGYAVAVVESPGLDASSTPALSVSTYSPVGAARGVTHIPGALLEANPVVAALADGFVVAFSSLTIDADGLGIALARVPANGGAVGQPVRANQTIALTQRDPDIVSLGNDIAVAWESDTVSGIPLRTVCWRRFSAQLAPVTAEACEQGQPSRSRVVLAAAGTELARAWLETSGGAAAVRLAFRSSTFTFPLSAVPPAGDRVALTALDSDTLLAVCTEGDGAEIAVVVNGQGAVAWGPARLNPAPAPPRYTPAVATTTAGIYLAWRENWSTSAPDGGPSPLHDETFVQKLSWGAGALDTTAVPIPLPRASAHRPGDQRAPALAATPLSPYGAIVAAWNDLTSTNYAGESAHGDVVVELIPTPILRLGASQ